MIKKNMFLRGFCMAAALALAAGNMPSVGLQSYAAVSENGEEAAETETEDQAAEAEGQAEESEAETEDQTEETETETEDQTEETETETEDQTEETEAETEDQTEETEAETEGQTEETETETEDQTGETEGETEGQTGETEEETEGQGTEAGTEAEGQDASEEKSGDAEETVAEEQSVETEEEGTQADPSEGSGSESDIDEEKAEDAALAEEEIPAEGLVEDPEAETLPAVEAELKPELLEAANTLSSVDIVVDWNLAGKTVSYGKSKITITNQDTFKSYEIIFSESQTGAALSDSTVLQAGKTYYVRFNVTLKSGYYVDSSTSFTLNDEPISMTFTGRATSFNLYGYNSLQNEALSEVTVKFTWPEDGDTVADAKNTISITNRDKFETCSIYFTKTGQSGQMADTEVFHGSTNYELHFNIRLKSGYAVDRATKITKNGANVDLGIPQGQQWNNFSFSHGATVVTPDLTALKELVTRFYRGCMGREPDSGGLNYWAQRLHKKKTTGAGMLEYFFNSSEFQSQGVTDEEYVNRLYLVIFNRSADASGKEYWLERLANGVSRTHLLYQFGASKEFKGLCSTYDITQGQVKITEDRDRNYGVTSFLARIYSIAFERSYDVSGLNYWAGQILNASSKTAKICSAAQYFFLSEEMKGLSLSNEQMLRRLYKVFMNREADSGGLSYWLDRLAGGMAMKDVIASFAYSKEFKQLMEQYGIK